MKTWQKHVYNKYKHARRKQPRTGPSVQPHQCLPLWLSALPSLLLSCLCASSLLDMSCPALPACAPIQKTHLKSVPGIWPRNRISRINIFIWVAGMGLHLLVEQIESCCGEEAQPYSAGKTEDVGNVIGEQCCVTPWVDWHPSLIRRTEVLLCGIYNERWAEHKNRK